MVKSHVLLEDDWVPEDGDDQIIELVLEVEREPGKSRAPKARRSAGTKGKSR